MAWNGRSDGWARAQKRRELVVLIIVAACIGATVGFAVYLLIQIGLADVGQITSLFSALSSIIEVPLGFLDLLGIDYNYYLSSYPLTGISIFATLFAVGVSLFPMTRFRKLTNGIAYRYFSTFDSFIFSKLSQAGAFDPLRGATMEADSVSLKWIKPTTNSNQKKGARLVAWERLEAFASLDSDCDSGENDFRWIVISGSAGSGKSRLALEFLRCKGRLEFIEVGDVETFAKHLPLPEFVDTKIDHVARKLRTSYRTFLIWLEFQTKRNKNTSDIVWDVGWLRPENMGAAIIDDRVQEILKTWRPRKPTMILLDDPTHSEDTSNLIKALQAQTREYKFPVRLIVVSQTVPVSLEYQYSRADGWKSDVVTGGDANGPITCVGKGWLSDNDCRAVWNDWAKATGASMVALSKPEDLERFYEITEGTPLLVELGFRHIESGKIWMLTKQELLRARAEKMIESLRHIGWEIEHVIALAISSVSGGIAVGSDMEGKYGDEVLNDHNITIEKRRVLTGLFRREELRGNRLPGIRPELVGDVFAIEVAKRWAQEDASGDPDPDESVRRQKEMSEKIARSAWFCNPHGALRTSLRMSQGGHSGSFLHEMLKEVPKGLAAEFKVPQTLAYCEYALVLPVEEWNARNFHRGVSFADEVEKLLPTLTASELVTVFEKFLGWLKIADAEAIIRPGVAARMLSNLLDAMSGAVVGVVEALPADRFSELLIGLLATLEELTGFSDNAYGREFQPSLKKLLFDYLMCNKESANGCWLELMENSLKLSQSDQYFTLLEYICEFHASSKQEVNLPALSSLSLEFQSAYEVLMSIPVAERVTIDERISSKDENSANFLGPVLNWHLLGAIKEQDLDQMNAIIAEAIRLAEPEGSSIEHVELFDIYAALFHYSTVTIHQQFDEYGIRPSFLENVERACQSGRADIAILRSLREYVRSEFSFTSPLTPGFTERQVSQHKTEWVLRILDNFGELSQDILASLEMYKIKSFLIGVQIVNGGLTSEAIEQLEQLDRSINQVCCGRFEFEAVRHLTWSWIFEKISNEGDEVVTLLSLEQVKKAYRNTRTFVESGLRPAADSEDDLEKELMYVSLLIVYRQLEEGLLCLRRISSNMYAIHSPDDIDAGLMLPRVWKSLAALCETQNNLKVVEEAVNQIERHRAWRASSAFNPGFEMSIECYWALAAMAYKNSNFEVTLSAARMLTSLIQDRAVSAEYSLREEDSAQSWLWQAKAWMFVMELTPNGDDGSTVQEIEKGYFDADQALVGMDNIGEIAPEFVQVQKDAAAALDRIREAGH